MLGIACYQEGIMGFQEGGPIFRGGENWKTVICAYGSVVFVVNGFRS